MIWLVLLGTAGADEPPVELTLGGDAKSFFLGTFPYEHDLLMPDGPQGSAMLDGRLKLEAAASLGGVELDLQAHQVLDATAMPLGAAGGVSASGPLGALGTGGAPPETDFERARFFERI